MRGQTEINSFLVMGIFAIVILIVSVIAFSFYSENTSKDENKETSDRGEIIELSTCNIDEDCITQYGEGYMCFLKECYAITEESSPQDNLEDQPIQLTGFFSNFITGEAISEEAGEAIYYNRGWVGIGTNEPRVSLDIKGKIKISDDGGTAEEGMIRFSGSSFQGYDGTNWLALSGGEGGIIAEVWQKTGTSAYYNDGNIGIGTTPQKKKLSVAGIIESTIGGFKFPDGTTQTTASSGTGGESQWSSGTGSIYYNSGNVGIGNTGPSHKLDVTGNINAYSLKVNGTSVSGGQWTTSGSNIYHNSGNVGIGTTNPAQKLNVIGNSDVTGIGYFGSMVNIGGSGWDGTLNVRPATDVQLLIGHSGGDLRLFVATDSDIDGADMQILAAKVGINRAPSTNTFEVEGSASKTTAGDWLANSDRRIKTDIQPIQDATEKIMKLNPVTFKYSEEYLKKHPSIENKDYYNFVAQEFQEVFPNHVKGSGEFLSDGSEILQIDTYAAQIIAIRAVQEQQSQIEQLKLENNDMKQSLCSLGISKWC